MSVDSRPRFFKFVVKSCLQRFMYAFHVKRGAIMDCCLTS